MTACHVRSHEAGAEEPRQDWLQWLHWVCSGEDYPVFAFPPDTSFICDGHVQGYYADPEADCQVRNRYHDIYIIYL